MYSASTPLGWQWMHGYIYIQQESLGFCNNQGNKGRRYSSKFEYRGRVEHPYSAHYLSVIIAKVKEGCTPPGGLQLMVGRDDKLQC